MNKNFYINADVGEGMGDDSGLMPLIQACNIACGGHAGNSFEMQKTIALAQKYNVRIGAHPSYPDTKNFGRRTLNLSKQELYNSLKAQISSLLDPLKKAIYTISNHTELFIMIATVIKILLKSYWKWLNHFVLMPLFSLHQTVF